MRTQFTAQVSHELQTPLSVIKGYSEALADQIYSSKEASGIYVILLTETDKISRLVDDLLDLSQMESGAYIIRKKDFLPTEMITRIFNRHKKLPSIKNFNMQLEVNYPETELFSGDSVRLEQAIRNILINAIKHVNDNGLIKITLSKINSKMQIDIFNSGLSIPEEELSNIFKSYYQGKTHHGGTGLGLAITHHIVALHSGSILVENKNSGVVFTLILP